MNVYDFDKTIYRYDCTKEFFLYELKKHPSLLRYFPIQLVGFIQYGLKIANITQMKKFFYVYLKGIKDIDKEIEEFWDKNISEINTFYIQNHKEDDIVISASAYFMVEPACKRLGIKTLIASQVDKKTGRVLSQNCSKKQKVIEFEKAGYKPNDVEEFYSDSHSDDYFAKISKKPYLVVKGVPEVWSNYNV